MEPEQCLSKNNHFSLLRQYPSVYLSQCLVNHQVFHCESRALAVITNLITKVHTYRSSTDYLGGTLCRCLFPLLWHGNHCCHLGLCEVPARSPQIRKSTGLCLYSSCAMAWKLSQGREVGQSCWLLISHSHSPHCLLSGVLKSVV